MLESPYFYFILGAIILFTVIDLIADWLNLKALRTDVPEPMRDVVDAETYRKSQAYTRVNARFGFVTTIFDLTILLLFWFLGGFDWLDQSLRALGFGEIITGLMFFGALFVGKTIIDLPFEYYSTFVIEERFGFNKSTRTTFWADQIKGLIISAIIGGILGALVLLFFQFFPDWGWLWAWMAVAAFSLLLTYLAPTCIMPLFNKFEPLQDGELKERIMTYAEKVDYPLAEVHVMDGSKRSTKSNAFFTGFGKNKKVALYDTLVENHTVDELVGVLAHEIGHYKKKHIPQMIGIALANMGVIFFLAGLFLNNEALHAAFGMQETSVYASLVFFGMLFIPLNRVLSMVQSILSRKNEFEADAFAATTTGQAQPMIDALKKLSKDNLSNLTPHPFYVFMNYSHPPVLLRLRALERLGAEVGDPRASAVSSSSG